MKAKLISIISLVIAVVLLACGFVIGFDRGPDIGGAYVMNVQINEAFNVADVEAMMKEAGATTCYVQKTQDLLGTGEYRGGESAIISFEVKDDTKVNEVYDKAEKLMGEKYFLKFPAEINSVSATMTRENTVKMWPAIIIFVLMVAYVFIRFGVKMGFVSIADMFIPVAATAGIIALTGTKVTGYTLPALVLAAALAFAFTVLFALLLKGTVQKMDSYRTAFDYSSKQISVIATVASAIIVIALVFVLIFGETLLKSFAINALVAVVINLATTLFVMPELALDSKKA